MSSVHRVVGMETEFGIADASRPHANVLALCGQIVNIYGDQGSASGVCGPVRWDYAGENPLNDARGFTLDRASAHPSLLTDDPNKPAPSGESSPILDSFAALESVTAVRRPSAAELALPVAPNSVLTNGARLYVDHAHPEYSAPEVRTPTEAVLYDRAGECIAREAMRLAQDQGINIVLYKNNVDGKGSAYGTHENYSMQRSVDFRSIIELLTPFLVTRPVLCGAGRVGLGKRSENPGFQISQRADYIENDIGIETTFNRPIVNTRDEPHAVQHLYRRLHVINGDANQFDISNFLKVGSTSLVLWLLENNPQAARSLAASTALHEPVRANQIVSYDPSLQTLLSMADGSKQTALDIQEKFLETIETCVDDHADSDADTRKVLTTWRTVLDCLRRDIFSAASQVEWVAKLRMLELMREREGAGWEDPKLKAFDIHWHDLRSERSIVNRLDQAGAVERLVSESEVAWACIHAPRSTRAYLRGALIERFPQAVASAGWEAITLDVPGHESLLRLALSHPERASYEHLGTIVEEASSLEDMVKCLAACDM